MTFPVFSFEFSLLKSSNNKAILFPIPCGNSNVILLHRCKREIG